MMLTPNLGGDASESRDPFTIPLTIRLRVLRFAGLVAVFSIFMATLTLLFSRNNGVTLQSFISSEKTAAQQSELLDNYNSYTGSVTSALGQSIDFFVGAAMPVAYLCFVSTHAMEVKQTLVMTALATGAPMLIKYLLGNGFSAMNVQISANRLKPVVISSDLSAGTSVVDTLLAASTNVSNLVPELETGNYVTNTVLRNALAPIVLETAPVCKSDSNVDSLNSGSMFTMGLVQSSGFPGRSW